MTPSESDELIHVTLSALRFAVFISICLRLENHFADIKLEKVSRYF